MCTSSPSMKAIPPPPVITPAKTATGVNVDSSVANPNTIRQGKSISGTYSKKNKLGSTNQTMGLSDTLGA